MATNRKRDFFKRFSSSTPKPNQPSQPPVPLQTLPVRPTVPSAANVTHTVIPAPLAPSVVPPQINSTGTAVAPVGAVTPPTVAPSPIDPSVNAQTGTAFKIAFDKHLNQLSDGEKAAFLASSAQPLTAKDIVKRADECGQNFATNSPFWAEKAEKLEGFLRVLKNSANIVKGASQIDVTAALVIGAAQGIIDVGLKFVSFFNKLTEMLCRFGDFLDVLALYDQSTTDQTILQNSLAAVYGDLLQFCQKARSVYIEMDGQEKKFIPIQVFWRQQWSPFETEFGDIEKRFLGHLEVLQHASSVATSNRLDALQSLLEYQEQRRQTKKQISQKEDFLNWLSNDSNETTHRKRRELHHPGTGDWLLWNWDFNNWFTSRGSSILWCYGGPGVGKSVLASTVVEHVLHEKARRDGLGHRNDMGVAFMYFDYRQRDTQALNQFICALLKQLCRDQNGVPPGLLESKQKARPKGDPEDFRLVAREYHEVFLIVDAIDECDTNERFNMIGFLIRMSRELRNVKIFISSRKETDITEALNKAEAPVIEVSAQSIAADIEDYVHHEIQELRKGRENGQKLHIKSDSLETEIIQTLTEKADGMFLWVQLQIESLCRISRLQNDNKIRSALSTLPKGLDETYVRIWEKIMDKEHDEKDLAVRVLQWVFYAKRPLTTQELQRALATQEALSLDGADASDVELISKDVILAACENLVVEVMHHFVANEELYDLEDEQPCFSTLRPLHYSTHEFFTRSEKSFPGPSSIGLLLDVTRAHSELAVACLSNLDEVFFSPAPTSIRMFFYDDQSDHEVPDDAHDSADDEIAKLFECYGSPTAFVGQHKRYAYRRFSWYAACFFDYHILHARFLSERLKHLLTRLFSGNSSGIQALLYIRSVEPVKSRPQLAGHSFISLQSQIPGTPEELFYTTLLSKVTELDGYFTQSSPTAVAWFYAVKTNSDFAVEQMIARGYDSHNLDVSGVSGLHYAARKRFIGMIRVLLDGGANANTRGPQDEHPLLIALDEGHEDVVALLLASGADPTVQGGEYGDALKSALMACPNAVDELRNLGADVNSQGGKYGTVLQTAMIKGDEATIDKLLARGCDVNAQGGEFGDALQAAAAYNHGPIVKKLLALGCRVDTCGGAFGSALHSAVFSNDEDIVDQLLAQGCQVNGQSRSFDNVLRTAVRMNHTNIVRKLFDAGADPNAQEGVLLQVPNDEMLELFLTRPNFTINSEGYRHLFLSAAECGNGGIIKMLLRRHDFAPTIDDYNKAFRVAACNRHRDVANTLLADQPDLAANIPSILLDYALHERCINCKWKTRRTSACPVSCLEDVGKVLTQPGVLARVPHSTLVHLLHKAAGFGHLDTLKLLLTLPNLDVHAKVGKYNTALHAAVFRENKEAVKILLGAGLNVNAQGRRGTVLMTAILSGCSRSLLRLLLKAGADVNAQISSGKDERLVSQLEPNVRAPYFGNALQAAAYRGSSGVVRQLLAAGAVVNMQGGWAGNALQAAAREIYDRYRMNSIRARNRGNVKVVKILLAANADVNAQGGEYGTALQAACHGTIESDAIVKTLLAAGADVNITGGRYGTALQAASVFGSETTVKMLLTAGADVNLKGGKHGTALQAAATSSSYGIVRMLLDAGADVNLKGGTHGTALRAAAAVGSHKVVETLLTAGANVNETAGTYSEALQAALANSNEAITEVLLAAGAHIGGKGGRYGSALQAASYGGTTGMVQYLIHAGAAVNAHGGEHGSALIAAASTNNSSQIIKLLLAAGADVNATEQHHGNALQAAAANGELESVKILLDAGADVNILGGKFGSPLQASSHRVDGVLETILDAGADVNAQGGIYGNALQRASYHLQFANVKALIDAGADVSVLGGRYGTALRAVKAGYHKISRQEGRDLRGKKIVALLLASGAEETNDLRKFTTKSQAWDAEFEGYPPGYDSETDESGLDDIRTTAMIDICFRGLPMRID